MPPTSCAADGEGLKFGALNIEAVADFLVQACLDFKIENLSIIFHGGEPTLLKPALFDFACVFLTEKTKGLTKLRFSMQTNGLYLPEIWLSLIEKHHISVGVSLDGSSEYNDIYRLDHMGRGSHQRISHNIVRLNERFAEGRIDPVGLVSVLNHAYDYKEIYRHFTEDLGEPPRVPWRLLGLSQASTAVA